MKTDNIKISVITVIYNGIDFIEDTIRSVIGQDYNNLEYIIIDGGSTDGTVELLKSYDNNVTRWISEKDGGIAEAFNKGLTHCTGDYVLFLNSDDMLTDPSVIQTIVDEINKNSHPCLIYGDFDIIDRNSGKPLYRGVVNFSCKGMIKRGEILPHPCLFTSKKYFDKYGTFDTWYRIAMDYELFLRGVFKETVVHVPVLTTKIRSGGASTGNRELVVEEIIAALEKNGHLRSPLAKLRRNLYFTFRFYVRKFLEYTFLYSSFTYLRNMIRRMSLPGSEKI